MSQLFCSIVPKLLRPYTQSKIIFAKYNDQMGVYKKNDLPDGDSLLHHNNIAIGEEDEGIEIPPSPEGIIDVHEIPEKLSQYVGSDFEVVDNPIISTREYIDEDRFYIDPREVWIENFDTIKEKKLGMASLHPDVFGAQPRIDVIKENVVWQRKYKYVSYANVKTTSEIRGSKKKPWPQKGTGRARHSCRKTPLWGKGAKAHGPRSPTTFFYMLPFYNRVLGLCSTLSVKLAQDDLHIVKDLEIPTDDPDYIKCLIKERMWGPSVLLIDNNDVMPFNLSIATDKIKHINLMPVYGLNVYSMLKHQTLVLSLSAARLIEDKILYQLNRIDNAKKITAFQVNQK